MQLVVIVKPRAGVLELDLGVEDDVVGHLIGRQQHQASHIETVLPLAGSGRILLTTELDLAVHAHLEARNRRSPYPEKVLVLGRIRRGAGGRLGQGGILLRWRRGWPDRPSLSCHRPRAPQRCSRPTKTTPPAASPSNAPIVARPCSRNSYARQKRYRSAAWTLAGARNRGST